MSAQSQHAAKPGRSTATTAGTRRRTPPLFQRVTVWLALVAGGLGFALALWFATDWQGMVLDEPTAGMPWHVIGLFLVTTFVPLLPIWPRLSDRLLAGAFVFVGTSLGFALGVAYGQTLF